MRGMPTFFRKLLKFIPSLVLFGCLTPIDFPLENQNWSFAISGQVSTVAHRNFVQVSRTNGVKSRPLPVSEAWVALYDDLGNSYQYEISTTPGVFLLPGFVGTPGRSYYVVVAPYEGGLYTSKPEILPTAVATDNPYYEFEERPYTDSEGTVLANGRFINILTKPVIPVTEDPLYLKWTVDETFIIVPTDFPDPFGVIPPSCYIRQGADPQRIQLFNSLENPVPSEEEGLLIASRPLDNSFHTRHYFMTYLSTLTPEAYDYWRKVNVLVNQVGSIFDTPPATITGNIIPDNNIVSPPVFGYFMAVNEDHHKFYLTRFEVPYPNLPYCEYYPFKPTNTYPYECLNCITHPNSTYAVPDEWD
jgi:hypothetical protein